MDRHITKIIYFDKETILNILQERNKGRKQTQTGTASSVQTTSEIEAEAQAKLNVNMPFLMRLSFLFSSKISAKFLLKRERETTITSTEISEFDELKPSLVEIKCTQLLDIENSSTSFRLAGNYLRCFGQKFEGLDVKEFNAVMGEFEGYDIYRTDNSRYVRFNNTAFVSNYKRNDLLSTKMTLYCVKVGDFSKDSFDFMKQLGKMEKIFTNIDRGNSLADLYPPKQKRSELLTSDIDKIPDVKIEDSIRLYDVLYACVATDNE